MAGYKPYLSHPWHGIPCGAGAPEVVNAFIEMTPADSVKYEIDKNSGFLKADRPQKFSNIVPALYGFIPQTYCAENVARLCQHYVGKTDIVGDGDPLDICVLTERNIIHGNILVPAIPIGGLRMIDGGEADDKIIAILKGDEVYQNWHSIGDCPDSLINRLKHYFLTYKQMPGEAPQKKTEIADIYDKETAYEVIQNSRKDYKLHYSNVLME
ncbi:Inorganic pyrophosphatase [Fulvivirga imtechensis AK7]|uniref:inorganic diphosphatase n=1 Tax=Fulvivirga imtechensis AK7 TaxID=1237149 RepID=L8JGL9_9BACT|nr:inorganic pyrophosphatase [Fulvivirga imtechensis]ELR68021.1 Inorganic pyrophosphatase [Fulvivirga imtechensis AK7]